MIDYWETIGRLAYDPALAKQFTDKFPQESAIPLVQIAGQNALNIPPGTLLAVQEFFALHLAEGTLSVMSAGEIFWTFGFPETAENISNIGRFLADKGLAGVVRSAGFFIALGMIMIDSELRNQISAKKPTFRRGPRMSAAELEIILLLAVSVDFVQRSNKLDFIWPHGQMCFDLAVPSPGNPHPLPLRGAKGASNY